VWKSRRESPSETARRYTVSGISTTAIPLKLTTAATAFRVTVCTRYTTSRSSRGLISLSEDIRPDYLDRGNHFQNIKMYREAIADYNRYIELNPRNPSAYMNRGNAHERLKEYDSAMFDYNKTLELKPDDTIANFNKGNVYDILGKPDSAVMQYDTVIMKDPRLAKAYYNRGTSYMSTKNYSAAVKDWEEAIRLNPPYEPDLGPRINRIRALIK
jgi:tetratricopeptide (TPR) repeat protein